MNTAASLRSRLALFWGARAQDLDSALGFPLSALKMLRNCLCLFAPNFAHAHVMLFRIKCLCPGKVTPNHQKK